jgi:hypothetical protein
LKLLWGNPEVHSFLITRYSLSSSGNFLSSWSPVLLPLLYVICWIRLNFNTISYLRLVLLSCTFFWVWWPMFWTHNPTYTHIHTHTHTHTIHSYFVSCQSHSYCFIPTLLPTVVKLWSFFPCGIWHLYFIFYFLGPNIFLGCWHWIRCMSWQANDGTNFSLIMTELHSKQRKILILQTCLSVDSVELNIFLFYLTLLGQK